LRMLGSFAGQARCGDHVNAPVFSLGWKPCRPERREVQRHNELGLEDVDGP
jgi:hypothetical protein